ncbi:UROD/MetE-like protein [Peniophora sp. CONT]|nr:UROD/MetE-like protein [Peniophora sp. CONT]
MLFGQKYALERHKSRCPSFLHHEIGPMSGLQFFSRVSGYSFGTPCPKSNNMYGTQCIMPIRYMVPARASSFPSTFNHHIMSSSQPRRFRAEHLGSLIRPDALLQLRAGIMTGATNREELAKAEKDAIRDIVQMQKDVGLKVVSDGEFTRFIFYDGVFNKLEGMQFAKVPLDQFMEYLGSVKAMHDFSQDGTFPSYICTGKLKRIQPFYVPEFEYLKTIVPPEEHANIKMTVCSPEWFHIRHGPHTYSKDAYSTDEEYFADLVTAYKAELQDLYAAGCRNIQFDDPQLIEFCSEESLEGMRNHGMDPDTLLQLYIDTYNRILEGRPRDMRVGVHICRGNFSENQYTTKHKDIVLGLVSTKTAELEDAEELKNRVRIAAELISQGVERRSKEEALKQICISPQCGFASKDDSHKFTHEDMVKKLRLVVQTAKAIWPDEA